MLNALVVILSLVLASVEADLLALPMFAYVDPRADPIEGFTPWTFQSELVAFRNQPDPPMFGFMRHFLMTPKHKGWRPDRLKYFMLHRDPDAKLTVSLPTRVSSGQLVYEPVELYTNLDGFVRENITVWLPSNHDTDKFEFTVRHATTSSESVTAVVYLMQPHGVTFICDIDDTLKPFGYTPSMILGHFFSDYHSIPGMLNLTHRLLAQSQSSSAHSQDVKTSNQFVYVSGGPWPVVPGVQAFLQDQGFPAGPSAIFDLKRLGTPDAFLKSVQRLSDMTELKLGFLRSMMHLYPQRQFVFIGDSLLGDPKTYGTMMREFNATRALKTLIRLVSLPEVLAFRNSRERFEHAFEGVSRERWMVFKDPKDVSGY